MNYELGRLQSLTKEQLDCVPRTVLWHARVVSEEMAMLEQAIADPYGRQAAVSDVEFSPNGHEEFAAKLKLTLQSK